MECPLLCKTSDGLFSTPQAVRYGTVRASGRALSLPPIPFPRLRLKAFICCKVQLQCLTIFFSDLYGVKEFSVLVYMGINKLRRDA